MDLISVQLLDAFGIMVLGMCLVFIFLSILILGVKLVASKFAPEIKPTTAQDVSVNAASSGQLTPQMIAAITSAIHQYRQKA